MPPKGIRVCFDTKTCDHGKDHAWQCRTCLDSYALRVARQEVYLCGDCRLKSIRYGYKWPAKGARTVVKQPTPAVEEVKITATCIEHKKTVKAGNHCSGCLEQFQYVVDQCANCSGYDPNAMKRFCEKHKKYWEQKRSQWRFDQKAIERATPYPVGKTEDFLRGMTELCFDPTSRKR